MIVCMDLDKITFPSIWLLTLNQKTAVRVFLSLIRSFGFTSFFFAAFPRLHLSLVLFQRKRESIRLLFPFRVFLLLPSSAFATFLLGSCPLWWR